MNENKPNEFDWLIALMQLNNLNRRIKETHMNYEDENAAYALKDEVIRKILTEKPECISVEYYYVPYIKYSMETKDKAGAMMRNENSGEPFEYYLAQIPKSSYDYEIPEKASVEVIFTCYGQKFSFHQPAHFISSLGIDVTSFPEKVWINSKNFAHELLVSTREEITKLLNL